MQISYMNNVAYVLTESTTQNDNTTRELYCFKHMHCTSCLLTVTINSIHENTNVIMSTENTYISCETQLNMRVIYEK